MNATTITRAGKCPVRAHRILMGEHRELLGYRLILRIFGVKSVNRGNLSRGGMSLAGRELWVMN